MIEGLAAEGVTVSVDTWRAGPARAALEAGASMVNDVSGLSDPALAELCAEHGADLVITHTRVRPKVKEYADVPDVIEDIVALWQERMGAAIESRCARGRGSCSIPASTSASRLEESVEILRRLPELEAFGRPLLLAISRKDFVGSITGRRPAERDAGTLGAIEPALDLAWTPSCACTTSRARADFLARPRRPARAGRGGRPRSCGAASSGGDGGVSTSRSPRSPTCTADHPHFVPSLLDRALVEINELAPDVVIVSGDLTGDGFRGEYELAREYLDRIECERMIVIPGNHDSRNVGYVHFEELFGERRSELHQDGVSILAVDSTEPDLDHGVIGRGRYEWIEERFKANEAYLRIFVLHHHLLPVPGTGRERNVVHDAGDTLECLQRADVHLVLSGHKHVPYAWRLEDLFVVNAGTVSTTRLRGKTKPCYNVIEASPERVAVYRKYPFHDREALVSASTRARSSTRRARRCWERRREGLDPGGRRPRHRADRRRAPSRPRCGRARPRRGRARARGGGVLRRRGEGPRRACSTTAEDHYGRAVVAGDSPAEVLRSLAARAAAARWWTWRTSPFSPRRSGWRWPPSPRTWVSRYEAPGLSLDAARATSDLDFAGPDARGDRHRQAHGQDGCGRPSGPAVARPRSRPVIVCMGRGGPAEPQVAEPGTGLAQLLALAARRPPRGFGLPRGRRARRGANGRLPPGGRRPAGRAGRVRTLPEGARARRVAEARTR